MSLDIIEQILEMQNYSVEKIAIDTENVHMECKKIGQTYWCLVLK